MDWTYWKWKSSWTNIFFHRNVNGEAYLNMINDHVVPFIEEELSRFQRQQHDKFRYLWWAQDDAPAHRRRIVTDRLQELFGQRVITLNHQVEWLQGLWTLPHWTSFYGVT